MSEGDTEGHTKGDTEGETVDPLSQLSKFTYTLEAARKKPKRVDRILRRSSLNFYAYNSCNKGKTLGLRSGYNHVQIDFVNLKPRGSGKFYRPGQAYYVMEYSQNIPERKRRLPSPLPSQFKDTPTAIQLPLETFNPPQFENNKLKVTYTDKNGKLCNVTLGPCNTPEKETEYECPVRGIDFNDDEEWKKMVEQWFQTKYDLAKKNALLSGEWQGKQQSMDPETLSAPDMERAEDLLKTITKETNKKAETTEEEAEKHLADAQKQLDEHYKIVNKTLGITSATPKEEQKIGGKKSRKQRRTKRRKSNRRKKGKKSKKH